MTQSFDREASVYALVVGAVVAQLREKRDWTQSELASRIETTQWTLSRIERGQASPDAFMVKRLAEAFDLTTAQLNHYFDDAFSKAEEAAQPAVRASKTKTAWWKIAFATAGVAGMVGLVAFAVGVALAEKEKEDEERRSAEKQLKRSRTAADERR